jgi:predicted PurR-regulated permease PerM
MTTQMNERLLTRSVKVIILLVLLVVVLVYAKPFLVPLTFAALIAMLLIPLSLKMEEWGLGRGLSILFSVLLFLGLIVGIIYVLVRQASDISQNAEQIEKNVEEKIRQVNTYISRTFGISRQKQTEIVQGGSESGGKISGMVTGTLSSLGSFLTNFILTIVYTFLFLYFRPHLKKFILMLVPAPNKKNAQVIIEEARGVSQKYITGLSWMILCLWIMYSIGFSLVGVKNAVLFAVICGLLEIVPFVGNLTGNLITIIAVVMQGGGMSMIFGVLIVYATVQFLQTYILEPLVVGSGVNINPLFTIAGIVAGELIWGIPGMILAIPLMGITKIVCDHIEPLKPYGYLIGEEKKKKTNLIEKIKGWFQKKTGK